MIYILIRYSLVSRKLQKNWASGEGDFQDYKKLILNDERLDARFKLLTAITLPSISQQEGIDFRKLKVILFASADMSKKHKGKLRNLCNEYKWLHVTYLGEDASYDDFDKTVDKDVKAYTSLRKAGTLYATLRLDDDDAISKTFIRNFKEYMKPTFIGYGVSFMRGYAAIFNVDTNQFESFHAMRAYSIAIGLGFINYHHFSSKKYSVDKISIYSLGNHIKISEKVPVIADAKHTAFLRTIYYGQDSNTDSSLAIFRKRAKIEKEVVLKDFNFI